MLRLVRLGLFLMVAIAALAAGPKATPLGMPAGPATASQHVAGPPNLADPQRPGASPSPFVYQPCRTMRWVPCERVLIQEP